MKNKIFLFISILMFTTLMGQDALNSEKTKYVISKYDNTTILAEIISQNEREVLVRTTDGREFYIPQHVISSISEQKVYKENEKVKNIGENKFATRYFITTNALPIQSGENYFALNLYGPELQFGVKGNVNVGIMTSWIGMPIVGDIKKNWEINKNLNVAVGGLIGFGSWIDPEVGFALPFGVLTAGNRNSNISASLGYGIVWDDTDNINAIVTNVAGMHRVSPHITLIFDSFIVLPRGIRNDPNDRYYGYGPDFDSFALLIPGLRWQKFENTAVQFGFTSYISQDYSGGVPLPMIRYMKAF